METAQTVEPGTKTDIIDPPAVAPTNTPPTKGANAERVHRAADGNPAAALEQSKIDTALPAGAAPAKPGLTEDARPTKRAEPTLAQIVKGAATDATQPSKPAEPTLAEPAKTAATAGANPTTAAEPAPAQPAKAAAKEGASPSAPQPTPPAANKGSASETATPSAPAQPAPAAPIPAEAANVMPGPADITAPISLDDVPLPLSKPARIANGSSGPIAIFVSRKEGKIYVRQNLAPLFDAPIKIENPSEPLGTHVFTAMDYLPDHSTFHWTVVTLPGAPPKAVEHWKYVKDGKGRRKRMRVEEQGAEPLPPTETPQEALARIEIPQDVIEQISQLIVPGSSLIVSDQGLGPETGSSTDFIVVTR